MLTFVLPSHILFITQTSHIDIKEKTKNLMKLKKFFYKTIEYYTEENVIASTGFKSLFSFIFKGLELKL